MSNITAKCTINLSTTETFTAAEQPAAGSDSERQLKGSILLDQSLSATKLPKLDKSPVYLKLTLGGGITTVDLTSVAGLVMPSGATRNLNMTGARLKGFEVKCAKGNNAARVLIAPGASNPYPLFGTSQSISVGPGRVVGSTWDAIEADSIPVDATHKTIDISGTAADVVELMLLFGTV